MESIQVFLDGIHLIHFEDVKPVTGAGDPRLSLELGVTPRFIIPFPTSVIPFLSKWFLLLLQKRFRRVEDHVQGDGTPQLAVHEVHALINLCGLMEVVNEAVLHRKLEHAYDAENHSHRGSPYHQVPVALDQRREKSGYGGG